MNNISIKDKTYLILTSYLCLTLAVCTYACCAFVALYNAGLETFDTLIESM